MQINKLKKRKGELLILALDAIMMKGLRFHKTFLEYVMEIKF